MAGSWEALLRRHNKYFVLWTCPVVIVPRHLLLGMTKPGHDLRHPSDLTYPGLYPSKAEGSSWDSRSKPEGCQRIPLPSNLQADLFSLAEFQGRAHGVAWGRKSCLQLRNQLRKAKKALHREAVGHCIMSTIAGISVLWEALACLQCSQREDWQEKQEEQPIVWQKDVDGLHGARAGGCLQEEQALGCLFP